MTSEKEPSLSYFAADPAFSQAERLRDACDRIRERADLTARAVGEIGIILLTGVGVAKVGDFFPFPGGLWSWFWLVMELVGLGLIATVFAFFMPRLWKLNEPILIGPDYEHRIAPNEKEQVSEILDQVKRRNGVRSLVAYEARGLRYQRIADRVDNDLGPILQRRASQIATEVLGTFERARLVIVRQRVARAIRGPGALVAYFGFALGLILVVTGADYLAGKRSEEVALCAQAESAGQAGGEFLSACSPQEGINEESRLDDHEGRSPTPLTPRMRRSVIQGILGLAVTVGSLPKDVWS
jgi:hypothetical protein